MYFRVVSMALITLILIGFLGCNDDPNRFAGDVDERQVLGDAIVESSQDTVDGREVMGDVVVELSPNTVGEGQVLGDPFVELSRNTNEICDQFSKAVDSESTQQAIIRIRELLQTNSTVLDAVYRMAVTLPRDEFARRQAVAPRSCNILAAAEDCAEGPARDSIRPFLEEFYSTILESVRSTGERRNIHSSMERMGIRVR